MNEDWCWKLDRWFRTTDGKIVGWTLFIVVLIVLVGTGMFDTGEAR